MKGFKILCLICMEESNFDDIESGSGMGDKSGIELAAMYPWKAEDYEARVQYLLAVHYPLYSLQLLLVVDIIR